MHHNNVTNYFARKNIKFIRQIISINIQMKIHIKPNYAEAPQYDNLSFTITW